MSPKRPSRIHVTLGAIALAAMLLSTPAHADDGQFPARLAAIGLLSKQSNTDALAQAETLKAALPPDASYGLRRDTLTILSRLLANAGKFDAAYATDEDLLRLATAAGDTDTANIARLYKVNKLLHGGDPADALVELTKQQAGIGKDASQELLWNLNITAGRTNGAMSKYEAALAHYLEALELADKQGSYSDQAKLLAINFVGRLYITMKNPDKALQTIDAALALPIAAQPLRAVGSLTFARGVALNQMGRPAEALIAFRKALNISTESGFAGLEAQVRGNISDLYLRQEDWVTAEREARAALVASERVGDEASAMMAKANIGFGLGGQGKTTEAMFFIGAVIKSLKDSGATADLDGILDETSRMYERSKLFAEALATVREQQDVQRKISKTDRERAVATLQERFDAGQREKQIELLARENQLKDADIRNRRLQMTVTLMGAALVLVAGVFIAMLYRRVRKNNLRLQDLNTQLEFHAMRDPLTGLFNRRSFVTKMEARAASAGVERRGRGLSTGGLVLMDIDHFKHINDTWGHTVGDGVLVEIAARLSRLVRDTDMALRWGGEEFLIYAPETDGDLLRMMVERLLRSVCSTPVQLGELSIPVTLTAGFIALPFSGLSEEDCGWEKAILLCDLALYLGKEHGRNRAVGLVRMEAPGAAALAAVENDLLAAAQQGIVELVEVAGPGARSALPLRRELGEPTLAA